MPTLDDNQLTEAIYKYYLRSIGYDKAIKIESENQNHPILQAAMKLFSYKKEAIYNEILQLNNQEKKLIYHYLFDHELPSARSITAYQNGKKIEKVFTQKLHSEFRVCLLLLIAECFTPENLVQLRKYAPHNFTAFAEEAFPSISPRKASTSTGYHYPLPELLAGILNSAYRFFEVMELYFTLIETLKDCSKPLFLLNATAFEDLSQLFSEVFDRLEYAWLKLDSVCSCEPHELQEEERDKTFGCNSQQTNFQAAAKHLQTTIAQTFKNMLANTISSSTKENKLFFKSPEEIRNFFTQTTQQYLTQLQERALLNQHVLKTIEDKLTVFQDSFSTYQYQSRIGKTYSVKHTISRLVDLLKNEENTKLTFYETHQKLINIIDERLNRPKSLFERLFCCFWSDHQYLQALETLKQDIENFQPPYHLSNEHTQGESDGGSVPASFADHSFLSETSTEIADEPVVLSISQAFENPLAGKPKDRTSAALTSKESIHSSPKTALTLAPALNYLLRPASPSGLTVA